MLFDNPRIALTLRDIPYGIFSDPGRNRAGLVVKVAGIERIGDSYLLFLKTGNRRKAYLMKYLKIDRKNSCWSFEGMINLSEIGISPESDFRLSYLERYGSWLFVIFPKFKYDDNGFITTIDFRRFRKLSAVLSPWGKDMVIAPELINGRWQMIYLLEQEIWTCRSSGKDNIEYWGNHQRVLKSDKLLKEWIVGLNRPLKTEKGWLISYYCDNPLGLRLLSLDLQDPAKVLAYSKKQVLSFGYHFMPGDWCLDNDGENVFLFYRDDEDRNTLRGEKRYVLQTSVKLGDIFNNLS